MKFAIHWTAKGCAILAASTEAEAKAKFENLTDAQLMDSLVECVAEVEESPDATMPLIRGVDTMPEHRSIAPKGAASAVEMWRAIVHAYFMHGLTNRDGIAALCDAAYDELLWIDENFKELEAGALDLDSLVEC